MVQRAVLFVATLVLLPPSGRAQQPPTFHDAVVVTATGEERRADEVPAASTVIPATLLRAEGVSAVADALRWVPGVVVLRSGLDAGVTSLFVRGTSSTHTLVMFDGVRLNSPFFGGYDWSLPLTVGLDRVEVVRGPYSALYGGDAVGGVVQLIPAHAGGTRLRVMIEGGSDGWQRGELEVGLAGGSWDAYVSAGSRAGRGALANDEFWSRAGMVTLGLAVGPAGRIGVLLRRTTGHTEIPFSGALLTPNRFTAADENLAAVPLRWQLGQGGELEVTLSRVERRLQFRDPDDPWGFVRGDTAADSDGANLAFHQRLGRHRLTLGGEWREDGVTDASNFGTTVNDRRLHTRSLFAQDDWASAGGFGVLAGLRWDEADPWGSELSPRLTVSWEGRPIRIWASFGRAFRAPGLGELYYPFSGNPDLAPERSRAAELGLSVPLSGGWSVLQVVGFANREHDLIDFDLARFRFENVAHASQNGVEASWIAMLGGRGHLRAALTWLDARDGDGQTLLRRPNWSGVLTLDGPLVGQVEGAASLVWVGSRPDADPVSLARVRQGGFVTANLALTLPLTTAFSARVRVENVAGRSYEEVRGYPAPGRRVMVGLETLLH
jgi:vitamin B12 transporter